MQMLSSLYYVSNSYLTSLQVKCDLLEVALNFLILCNCIEMYQFKGTKSIQKVMRI